MCSGGASSFSPMLDIGHLVRFAGYGFSAHYKESTSGTALQKIPLVSYVGQRKELLSSSILDSDSKSGPPSRRTGAQQGMRE